MYPAFAPMNLEFPNKDICTFEQGYPSVIQ
jgi:hypothetical protein